ncbi:hypothetical protein C806_02331 [Lachnospiraceae bacterium 3-1]|nr:hypothetical protein C806_02331 [Lachnospiraceae bacterium 3-1]
MTEEGLSFQFDNPHSYSFRKTLLRESVKVSFDRKNNIFLIRKGYASFIDRIRPNTLQRYKPPIPTIP